MNLSGRSLAVLLCCIPLNAYDFSQCVQYHRLATHGMSVSLLWHDKQVAFLRSATPPKGVKILKRDPFIGFYLIQAPKTRFAYNLLDIDAQAYKRALAGIHARAQTGSIVERQGGFLDFARFSAPLGVGGVVSNICYQIYGVGVGKYEFVETKYLKRFLAQKSAYYGDIGVRMRSGSAVVQSVDPFFPHNPFLEGDVILKVNNQPVHNARDIEWVVSNLAYQSHARITLKRRNLTKEVVVKVGKLYGGFLLPDTFLERFGITLDHNLVITKATRLAPPLDTLQVGDRLLWINKRPIVSGGQSPRVALQRALSAAFMQGRIEMLILRNGFEFYVRL
ncbi:PDZ domain-containing protein [Helicobacter salomonis]|uniref:PDZ domain-containing protein n=1 Tax=Helicobacter salomonis TaxID=56878 RepID=UPI001F2DA3FC|nr:PDZ domain-containing protein [Helicobacter salomonis]